jgi:hypothetical protein
LAASVSHPEKKEGKIALACINGILPVFPIFSFQGGVR